MGKKKSLVDKLREKSGVRYHNGLFPIFEGQVVNITGEIVSAHTPFAGKWCDLVAGKIVDARKIELHPYQITWLKPA